MANKVSLTPLISILLFLSSIITIQALLAQPLTISKNKAGNTANGDSFSPSSTADGQFIVFSSNADDLVEGDSNFYSDIFIYHSDTQSIEKVSQGLNAEESNGNSYYPSISDDGRFVVFQSQALNLVEENIYGGEILHPKIGTLHGKFQVFLFDRQTNKTKRISINNTNQQIVYGDKFPTISANGQTIYYTQEASRLTDNIVQYDIESEKSIRIDIQGCHKGGKIDSVKSSSNGGFISFSIGNAESANICIYDQNIKSSRSVYTQVTDEIFYSGVYGSHPDISDDGRYTVFETYKYDNFSGSDGWGLAINLDKIYLYDNTFKGIHNIYQNSGEHRWYIYNSMDVSATAIHSYNLIAPTISNDGRYIAYTGSDKNDIGDQNQIGDAYIYSIINKTHKRITHSLKGYAPNEQTQSGWVSGQPNKVLIVSSASNLIDNDFNQSKDIFLLDTSEFDHQPLASAEMLSTGDTLAINFPVEDPSLNYYFGLQTPNQGVFLLNQNKEFIPFSGTFPNNSIISNTQTFTDISISENWPSGSYTLLALRSTEKLNSFNEVSEPNQLLTTNLSINFLAPNQLVKENLTGRCEGKLSNTYAYTLFSETNNDLNEIFICDTSNGSKKQVKTNEPDEYFYGYYWSSFSDNDQWVVFQTRLKTENRDKLYLYNQQTETASQILAEKNLGYIRDLGISGNGHSIWFQTSQADIVSGISPQSGGLYLWDRKSNLIRYIAERVNGQSVIDYDGTMLVYFSSPQLYLYDQNLDSIRELNLDLKNITDSPRVPFFTGKYRSPYPNISYQSISKDGQVISYQLFNTAGLINSNNPQYLAVYDRNTNINQLLKTDNDQLIYGRMSKASLNQNGRFVLFMSAEVLAANSDNLPSLPGHYVYLFDRFNNKLTLLHSNVESQDLKISDDGYSYRLGDSLYSLNN